MEFEVQNSKFPPRMYSTRKTLGLNRFFKKKRKMKRKSNHLLLLGFCKSHRNFLFIRTPSSLDDFLSSFFLSSEAILHNIVPSVHSFIPSPFCTHLVFASMDRFLL
eukprot:Sdes_comp21537_c0_seq1m20150